jgi:enamine deaminase RidA (YjgF/YER057c/UK114 family)
MSRSRINSGSKFEELAGYSRAVIDGNWIFVSGTSGHDPKTGEIEEGVEAQTRQSLKVIEEALTEANSCLEDIVRVRVFASEREYVWPISEILKEKMDHFRPTNTTLITGFADPAMKMEIEVTALRQTD